MINDIETILAGISVIAFCIIMIICMTPIGGLLIVSLFEYNKKKNKKC